MKPGSGILTLGFLFAALTSTLLGQSFRIPLYISASGGYLDTLWFGVDTSATFCADVELGENQIPPPPPGGWFDARFLYPRSGSGAICFDQGMLLDLRPFVSTTQIDTYKVRIQVGNYGYGGHPVTISWPNLASYYTNNVWLRRGITGGLTNLNMKTNTSYVLPYEDPVIFYIITGDPGYVPQPPNVTTGYGNQSTLSSGVLTGTVNPNSAATTGWFEWGTTTSYGNSTTAQSVGSGENSFFISSTISGLSPGTTYHFRCNGQNVNGTTHGADGSFTTILDIVSPEMFPIHVTDNHYSLVNLFIGVDSLATFCLDPGLGENALPPPPAGGVFDARLVWPRAGSNAICFDQGTLKDLRPYINPSQVDTFKIKFQSDEYDSIIFVWPDISAYFSGSVKLVDQYGGLAVNVDMKAETSYTITTGNYYFNSLLVIAGTPPANRPPAVMTNPAGNIIYTSAQLDGIANPNGFVSTGWFEWGTDVNYGHTTSLQTLGNGATVIPIAQVISGLSPGVVYHYRVVAQNSNGTMEGPDRTFTTSGVTNQYGVASGWNMLSLPMIVGDARKTVLFPAATSLASTYVNGQGFVPHDTLTNGVGYWLKFPSAQNVPVTGIPVVQDTIEVKAGWNMVGTITGSVDASTIVQIPPGILQSAFFEFNGGYTAATVLDPAKGYWVKSSVNGQLVLTSGSTRPTGVTRKAK